MYYYTEGAKPGWSFGTRRQLEDDWLTQMSGIVSLSGYEQCKMCALFGKAHLDSLLFTTQEASEETTVAQHGHMTHVGAVLTAVSSHQNTCSDKTGGRIRSLSRLRASPHATVMWGCRERRLMFMSVFLLSVQPKAQQKWGISVISLTGVWLASCCSRWKISCSCLIFCLMFLSLTYQLQLYPSPSCYIFGTQKICNCRTDGRLYKTSLK